MALKVFDVLGKEVAALVNDDAATLSRGIYYYRMESQIKMLVKKMMILK